MNLSKDIANGRRLEFNSNIAVLVDGSQYSFLLSGDLLLGFYDFQEPFRC